MKSKIGSNFEDEHKTNHVEMKFSGDTGNDTKEKLAKLIELIWDEFYLCDPRSASKDS